MAGQAMNRFIQWFNFAGIFALAVLCAFQWRTNMHLNLRMTDLENTQLQQLAKIADQDKTIKGAAADLDDFRERLTLSDAALKEAEEKFKALEHERDKLVLERDRLKEDLDQWKAALAARDAALKQSNEQSKTLADARNDAIAKFNDLADKYNALVKESDKARATK
jgi:uncharacterized coiled-coil DUF342 family protein